MKTRNKPWKLSLRWIQTTWEIELRGLEPNRTYTITRFPDGDVVQDVADVGGRIQLSDIGFTKEVLFLVE